MFDWKMVRTVLLLAVVAGLCYFGYRSYLQMQCASGPSTSEACVAYYGR